MKVLKTLVMLLVSLVLLVGASLDLGEIPVQESPVETEPPMIEPEPEPEPEPIIVDQEVVDEIIPVENPYEFQTLLNATFRLETGNGTSRLWLEDNNPGGIKCGKEYCSFASPEEGMVRLTRLLERYVDKFGYDLKAIRDLYCQCGEQDLITFTRIYNEEMIKLQEENPYE